METVIPFEIIKNWINEEQALGSEEANSVVLATASASGEVHSRIVAIREINDYGVLFFTQKRSRKAKDLKENSSASMTLWLPLRKREVVLDGIVEPLTQTENERYWETLPRERQLRFFVYKTGQPIDSLKTLQDEYATLEKELKNQKIPMNDCYCGYCLIPHRIYFYTLRENTFSEVNQYVRLEQTWEHQQISP